MLHEFVRLCFDFVCDLWQKLTSKYKSWIDVVVYMNNCSRKFIVETDVLKLLSEMNLKIHCDIYFDGEIDEDNNVEELKT